MESPLPIRLIYNGILPDSPYYSNVIKIRNKIFVDIPYLNDIGLIREKRAKAL